MSGSGNSELSYNFTVSEDIIGPLMAAVVALEMILAVSANSFILIFTLYDSKSLRKSSTIFLMSLTLSNLDMSVVYMPFTAITAGAGEWIFGASDVEKVWVCRIVALLFSIAVSASVHTLAAISFERFLFIVKPVRHRQIMKPWVAVLVVLGILLAAILLNIIPFLGLGQYAFSPSIASCIPIWSGNTNYVIYITVESTIPLGIILVTTVWTFLFTRRFIRKRYEHQRAISVESIHVVHKHTYNHQMGKLCGIFGMLLLVNAISFLPFISLSIVGAFVGFNSVPAPLYAAVFILFLLSNVTNPLVQSYFRRELWESVLLFGKRIKSCFPHSRDERDSSCATRITTCATDASTRLQIREDRSHFNIVLEVDVHSREEIEPNEFQLTEGMKAENNSAHDRSRVVETEFNLTMKHDDEISPPCAYAATEVVNEWKLQKRRNTI